MKKTILAMFFAAMAFMSFNAMAGFESPSGVMAQTELVSYSAVDMSASLEKETTCVAMATGEEDYKTTDNVLAFGGDEDPDGGGDEMTARPNNDGLVMVASNGVNVTLDIVA